MNIVGLVINSSWQQFFLIPFLFLRCEEKDLFNGYLKPQYVCNTEKGSIQNWQNQSDFLILFETVSV